MGYTCPFILSCTFMIIDFCFFIFVIRGRYIQGWLISKVKEILVVLGIYRGHMNRKDGGEMIFFFVKGKFYVLFRVGNVKFIGKKKKTLLFLI